MPNYPTRQSEIKSLIHINLDNYKEVQQREHRNICIFKIYYYFLSVRRDSRWSRLEEERCKRIYLSSPYEEEYLTEVVTWRMKHIFRSYRWSIVEIDWMWEEVVKDYWLPYILNLPNKMDDGSYSFK